MLQISLEVRQADNYLLLAMSSANPGSGASKDTIDTILGLTADVCTSFRYYQMASGAMYCTIANRVQYSNIPGKWSEKKCAVDLVRDHSEQK